MKKALASITVAALAVSTLAISAMAVDVAEDKIPGAYVDTFKDVSSIADAGWRGDISSWLNINQNAIPDDYDNEVDTSADTLENGIFKMVMPGFSKFAAGYTDGANAAEVVAIRLKSSVATTDADLNITGTSWGNIDAVDAAKNIASCKDIFGNALSLTTDWQTWIIDVNASGFSAPAGEIAIWLAPRTALTLEIDYVAYGAKADYAGIEGDAAPVVDAPKDAPVATTDTSKAANPNTGVEGVATVAGIALIASASIVLTKKRK